MPLLFPLRPKAGSTGAIPAILDPALPTSPLPGSIVDDDDGAGWHLLQSATLAVVLAAAVATTSRTVQAQSEPDELAPICGGAGSVFSMDLWSATTGRPRLLYMGGDEAIVPQPGPPAVLDDSDTGGPWVTVERSTWIPVPWQYGGAEGIASAPATGGANGATGFLPDLWPATTGKPRIIQLGATDEIVPQPAPFGLDELYWDTPRAIVVPPRVVLAASDEVIIPQAAPLHVDEVYWDRPPAFPTVMRGPLIVEDTPEIVPQPVPFRLEEGTWEPGFVTPAVRWTAVSQWQDEVVASLHIDEMAPDPWLLLPVKRVIVLPSPDEYDVSLGVLNTGFPRSGINSVSFDAMVTVAVFDSLVTLGVTDSLTTTSAFDG